MKDTFLLKWTGKWIIALGLGGFVFTLFFDWLTKGIYPIFSAFEWAQKLGLIVFFIITSAGYIIHQALHSIQKSFEEEKEVFEREKVASDKLINEYLELIDEYEKRMGKVK